MGVSADGIDGRSRESARSADVQFYAAIKERDLVRNLSPHSVSRANDEILPATGRSSHAYGEELRRVAGVPKIIFNVLSHPHDLT